MNERATVFTNMIVFYNQNITNNSWLKIGNVHASNIIDKFNSKKSISFDITKFGKYSAHLNMRMMFWSKCFIESKISNEYKTFWFNNEDIRNQFISLTNSSLFFLFWEIISDCWHITNREMALLKYTFTTEDIKVNTLSKLAISLEKNLELKKKYVGTKQTEYEYYHKLSKKIIDDIDCQLSRHYGFTEEELDFIINYDIKYRMGKELDAYIEGALGKENIKTRE